MGNSDQCARGKLKLDVPLTQIVREHVSEDRYRLLDIKLEHVLALDELPPHHHDPFDRLLIAQARSERMPLVSMDRALADYPIELFW